MPRDVIGHDRHPKHEVRRRGHPISAVREVFVWSEQEAGAHASLNIPPPLSARAPHIQVLGKLTLSHRDTRGSKDETDSSSVQMFIKDPSRSPIAPWA